MKLPAPPVGKDGKPAEKEADAKAVKPPVGKDKETLSPSNGKTPEDSGAKGGAAPQAPPLDSVGDPSLEQDVQLQKAVELLKSWKIFKEMKVS